MIKLNGKSVIIKLAQLIAFILMGVISRVLPHPANFAPIAGMALFGGTYLKKKEAFVIPITAMIISDFFIGFDSIPMRLTVYGCFLISVLIGFWIKNHKNAKNILLATLFSSVIFFLITNFSVWLFGTMYPKNLIGIFECYMFAIPFFRNTLAGDLFYSGVFFGGYELARNFIRNRKLILTN